MGGGGIEGLSPRGYMQVSLIAKHRSLNPGRLAEPAGIVERACAVRAAGQYAANCREVILPTSQYTRLSAQNLRNPFESMHTQAKEAASRLRLQAGLHELRLLDFQLKRSSQMNSCVSWKAANIQLRYET